MRWEVDHDGRALADADGMHYCLQRALAEGVPVMDGAWLAEVTEEQLREIFRGGNSELQLLDERARIWREVGATLVERYDGRFSNVFDSAGSCAEFLDVLTRDFPRFDDTADVRRRDRALLEAGPALGVDPAGDAPGRHRVRRPGPPDRVRRLHRPGRAARPRDHALLGRAGGGDPRGPPVEAGSPWEVEIRAHTIYACDELTRRVNELRPPELQAIVPQVDARLWVPFHRTHYPHHLTRTIYY